MDYEGYSLDSTSVYLKWNGNSNYTVYRGNTSDVSTFVQVGSAYSNYFIDTTAPLNNKYFYALKNNPPLQSNFSAIVEVYHHKTAKLLEVKAVSSLSVEIKFSEKIKTVVENLQSF